VLGHCVSLAISLGQTRWVFQSDVGSGVRAEEVTVYKGAKQRIAPSPRKSDRTCRSTAASLSFAVKGN